jgi:hypothetical protein
MKNIVATIVKAQGDIVYEAPKNTYRVSTPSGLRLTMFTRRRSEVIMGIQAKIWRSCSPPGSCWRWEDPLARVANA